MANSVKTKKFVAVKVDMSAWPIMEMNLFDRSRCPFEGSDLPGWNRLQREKFYVRVNPESGCCIPENQPSGRGHIQYGWGVKKNGKSFTPYLHVLVFQAFAGRAVTGIPRPGYVVHHICECKSCINPDHLIEMTKEDHELFHNKNKQASFDKRSIIRLLTALYDACLAVKKMPFEAVEDLMASHIELKKRAWALKIMAAWRVICGLPL